MERTRLTRRAGVLLYKRRRIRSTINHQHTSISPARTLVRLKATTARAKYESYRFLNLPIQYTSTSMLLLCFLRDSRR